MPAVKSEMLKHLNGALDLENKGFDMYKRFAEKAKNELAKFLFSKLRDEEIVHAKMIDELISKVKSGQISEIGTNTIMDVTKDFTPISSEDIFKISFTKSIKIKKSSSEALDFALSVEMKARDYYSGLGRMATSPDVKNVFEILEKFEQTHVDIIADTITYMKKQGIYI